MQKEGTQEAYKLRCKDIKYKVNKEKGRGCHFALCYFYIFLFYQI